MSQPGVSFRPVTKRPRVLVVLGTRAWRVWILPFLEDPRFLTEVVHRPPHGVRPGQYDAVLFLSRHDTLRQDTGLAGALATAHVSAIVCQPKAMVKLGLSKRLMARRAAVIEGMHPIPEMTPADAAKYLGARPGRIVVAKPNDGTEGVGLKLFREARDLTTTGTRLYEGGYVLQPFLAGDEFSINMVWHNRRANIYPPVAKGRVDTRATHPIYRTRTCPAGLRRDPAWPGLAESCLRYLDAFKPSGLVEVEFIRRRGRFFLLDVNPRLSATLRLTAVASGTNPLTDLIAAACGVGELGYAVRTRRHAIEWPLTHSIEPGVRDRLTERADVWVSTRITLAAPDEATLAARAAEVRATLRARP